MKIFLHFQHLPFFGDSINVIFLLKIILDKLDES